MTIRLTKGKNPSRPDTLTCTRDDGSLTWWPLSPHFAQHDLLHYVVETKRGLKTAFFGLVAAGRDIDSFGTRDGKKDTYTEDEIEAEILVGLLQAEKHDGTQSSTEFLDTLAQTCASRGWPTPRLTEQQLDHIRSTARDLEEKWKALPRGSSMDLVFPTRAG